jgi:DNA methylase
VGRRIPRLPHVVASVEEIIVVHRGSWKRTVDAGRQHDFGHDDWLQFCGPRGLWRFAGVHDTRHPAPFPEELPRRLIKLFSFPSDPVLDPFVGSGTTSLIANRLDRPSYGYDISAQYVADARARLHREAA